MYILYYGPAFQLSIQQLSVQTTVLFRCLPLQDLPVVGVHLLKRMPPRILLFNALVDTNVSLFSQTVLYTNLLMLHVNAKSHCKSIPPLNPVLYIDATTIVT